MASIVRWGVGLFGPAIAGWALACGPHGDFAPEAEDAAVVDVTPAPDVFEAASLPDVKVAFADGSPCSQPAFDSGSLEAGTELVYAHSSETLYTVDTTTYAMTEVGPFTGCNPTSDGGLVGNCAAIDLAIDGNMDAYITMPTGLARVDLTTAACTVIAKTTAGYPNSLSFVPAGTLDPEVEALVGYRGGDYERIDTCSGAITTIGSLPSGYSSAGDLVSVKGGGTFLAAAGNGCNDCLLEVDPTTGSMIKNYGSLKHYNVWGVAYWAGTVFGFDDQGHVFTVTWDGTKIVTADIAVTPSTIGFYGAGSTTFAPVAAADGGTIPIN
jgi:hypothetical protein